LIVKGFWERRRPVVKKAGKEGRSRGKERTTVGRKDGLEGRKRGGERERERREAGGEK
jgi:hypothetical protein